MPRIRSIKPDFFTSEQIVSVSIPARYLFEGIWVFGDDDGYIAHSPIQMKMRIFPGDSVEVPELIAELLGAGLVRIVQTDQGEALWVPSFRNHQSPKYPTPTKYTRDGQSLTQRSPSPGGKVPKSSPSTHPGEERRGEERREKKNTAHPADAPGAQINRMFDTFWQAWPVKKGKEPARKSFIKAIKAGADIAAIMAGVEAYKAELGSLMGGKTIDGRTPKYAQGWLTDKRWEDEPSSASVADINAQWDAAMGETKPDPCANGHKWAADDSCVRCLQLRNEGER